MDETYSGNLLLISVATAINLEVDLGTLAFESVERVECDGRGVQPPT